MSEAIQQLPPPLLSTRKLAERWGCSSAFVCKIIRSGELSAIQLGSQYRINIEDVIEFEERKKCHAQNKELQSIHYENDMESFTFNGGKVEKLDAFRLGQATRKKQN